MPNLKTIFAKVVKQIIAVVKCIMWPLSKSSFPVDFACQKLFGKVTKDDHMPIAKRPNWSYDPGTAVSRNCEDLVIGYF